MADLDCNQKSKKIVIRNVPKPRPGPNQILVKIEKAALCHSDLEHSDEHHPATLGHEGAGRVEELHPSVANKFFRTGDKIGYLSTFGSCGECMECLIHEPTCAAGRRTAHGFTFNGLFSEFVVVDYCDCIHLPESFDSNSIVAPIFCAGIASFHSVGSADLERGDWFAIVGAGGLGPIAAHIAKAMHLRVVVLDSNDATLEVCKTWGADAVFNSRSNKDYVAQLRRLSQGGVKAACIYSTADAVSLLRPLFKLQRTRADFSPPQAYADSPAILRPDGIMMAVDLPHHATRTSSIDLALGKLRIGSERKLLQRVKGAMGVNGRTDGKPDVPVRGLDELGTRVNETRAWTCERNTSVSSEKSVKFGDITYNED
nr:uncharacterized protein LOC112012208 [Quercus suber]